MAAISLEKASDILGHINSLINSKYEPYLVCGLKALRMIFYKVQEWVNIECTMMDNETSEQNAAICVKHLEQIAKSSGMKKALRWQTDAGMLAQNIQTELEFYVNNFTKKREFGGSPSVQKILKEGIQPWADDGIEIFVAKPPPPRW